MQRLALSLLLLLMATPALSSPATAARAAAKDLATLAEEDRPNQRYFWVAIDDKKERADFFIAFKFHCNLLSKEPELVDPVEVTPTLWRVDITEVGWDAKVLEKAADIDFYFRDKVPRRAISPRLPAPIRRGKGKRPVRKPVGLPRPVAKVSVPASWLPVRDITYLRAETGSEAPILNAQWFFVQTARQLDLRNKQTGMGYYDMLGLKNRGDFFKLIGLDEKESIKRKMEVRAALDRSGVSAANRQIVRLQSLNGGVWTTLDTDDQSEEGIAVENIRRGEFKHKAEEHYGFLLNKLPVTLLNENDKAGTLQAKAPDFIGHDDSKLRIGKDSPIHANLSCIRCHEGSVLQPVKDWVRRTYRAGGPLRLGATDKKVQLEFKRQYLSDLDASLKEDRDRYVRAIQLATVTKATPKGLGAKEAAVIYGMAWNNYVERPVTLTDAARELGTTPARFALALKLAGGSIEGVKPTLAPFVDVPPGTTSRLSFEASFSKAQEYLRGVKP